jgi:hypothetical protein
MLTALSMRADVTVMDWRRVGLYDSGRTVVPGEAGGPGQGPSQEPGLSGDWTGVGLRLRGAEPEKAQEPTKKRFTWKRRWGLSLERW